MKPREIILNKLSKKASERNGIANPVSSTTITQMEIMNSYFPEAHYAKKMYELSRAAYEVLGYDAIMPYFSVVIEAFAMGANVDWGAPDMMPQIIGKMYKKITQISRSIKISWTISAVKALLGCISMLKKNYPDVAVIGKVFGPWTLGYDLFGVEDFLIKTITDRRKRL
jgi:uroporphyrinogen-III decarboxylase